MTTPDPQADHDWRAPVAGEPREEDAVCRKCGAYANSEANEPCPIDLDKVNAERHQADRVEATERRVAIMSGVLLANTRISPAMANAIARAWIYADPATAQLAELKAREAELVKALKAIYDVTNEPETVKSMVMKAVCPLGVIDETDIAWAQEIHRARGS